MEQNKKDSIYLAALAGLLHDVGKFAQRAGLGISRTWDNEAEKDYKYRHALQTLDFIESYVPEPWRGQVKHQAANHHRPQNTQEQLIQLADHLSAGERAYSMDPGEDDRAIHPRQMQSIFCSLAIPDAQGQLLKAPQTRYLPLAPLALQAKIIFPQDPIEEASDVWAAYLRLWDNFCEKVQQLEKAHQTRGNLAVYLENLLLLFHQFTWCVPAAYYKAVPDISLYDHGRMTAALAAVLFGHEWGAKELEKLSQDTQASDAEVALLVGGDLSGVQAFIYTITARGATSALRGRSFYLSLLTEAVARFILSRLELPITNLIYAGGGNFYLLARPDDRERLGEIQAEISRVLLQHHRGDLYVALSFQALEARDFFHGALSTRWDELGDGLQQAKLRRFIELGEEVQSLFQPQGHGGNEDQQCRVCGHEHQNTNPDKEAVTPDDPEGVRKCPACFGFEDLGRQLRSAHYLSLKHQDPTIPEVLRLDEPPGDWFAVLSAFGLGVELLAEPDKNNKTPRTLLALKDSAQTDLTPTAKTAVGRRFLVNVTPTITSQEIHQLRQQGIKDLPVEGSVKPFHAMEAQSCGIARLGVLLIDVDGLGNIFSKGLGDQATLSRIASLSSAFSLFFEGWVEVLAENRNQSGQGNPQRGELLYSIYSGGDDLFFVGAWDEVVELAIQIRSNLSLYAASHPGITASAGIVLVSGKYPLYQAAEAVQRAEQMAKTIRWTRRPNIDDNEIAVPTTTGKISNTRLNERKQHICEKDAVTFLNQALPWSTFGLDECSQPGLKNAHALMHLLVQLVSEKGSNRSLLRRLVRLHEQQQEALEKRRQEGKDTGLFGQQQALWGPWQWLGFYTLSRLARQTRSIDLEDLRNKMKEENFRSLEWAGLAARWAELIIRKGSN